MTVSEWIFLEVVPWILGVTTWAYHRFWVNIGKALLWYDKVSMRPAILVYRAGTWVCGVTGRTIRNPFGLFNVSLRFVVRRCKDFGWLLEAR